MDKSFWQTIQLNDYAVPIGHSVMKLTPELLALFGDTDPELRDEIALPIFGRWIQRDHYSPGELRILVGELTRSLMVGLGEIGGDSVFLRSCAVQGLAELVNYDNRNAFLEADESHLLQAEAINYLKSELDLRGYVTGKGWANAVGNTAELLTALAKSRHAGAKEQIDLLEAIAEKVTHTGMLVFLYDEDEWLAMIVTTILQRGLLDLGILLDWLDRFAHPVGRAPWEQSFLSEYDRRAFVNTKTFLRSLYFQLARLDLPASPLGDFTTKVRQTLQDISRRY